MGENNTGDLNYTVKELILDESFIRWVKFALPEDDEKWQEVLLQHPELKNRFAEARLWIEKISFTEKLPSVEEESRFAARMQAAINANTEKETVVRRLIPSWLRVAAVLTGIMISALASYWGYTYYSFKHITTGYGELTRIILPDSSEVMLNANSTVRYARSWDKDQMRELWLDGEAYFIVKHLNKDQNHIKNSERFVVHTTDMNIQVLGTSFNVKARRNKTNVTLTTGKVKLTLNDQPKSELIMKPGDMVAYSGKSHVLLKKTVNPVNTAAWKEHKMVFEKQSIEEIAQLIEDDFGYKVKIEAPSLHNRTISGTVTIHTEDELVKVLEDLLSVKIKKDRARKTLIIQEKN